jgi:hypothetical protein
MAVRWLPVPALPDIEENHRSQGSGELRYEDVAQDGRLSIHAMPQAIGWVWQDLMAKLPATMQMARQGVIPILTRLVIHSFESPVRVDKPMHSDGGFYLARNLAADKLFLNMEANVRGAGGRMIPETGPFDLCAAGHVFAEHTFTNIFAAAGKRAVTSLDTPGYPKIPTEIYDAAPPHNAGQLRTDDAWIVPCQRVADQLATSLDHTDSNQHVNSLTYIRFFIDAVQRRIQQAISEGVPIQKRPRLVRAVEIAYRKPCFAGDVIQADVGLFASAVAVSANKSPVAASGEMLGAAGALTRLGDDKPCVYVRLAML